MRDIFLMLFLWFCSAMAEPGRTDFGDVLPGAELDLGPVLSVSSVSASGKCCWVKTVGSVGKSAASAFKR